MRKFATTTRDVTMKTRDVAMGIAKKDHKDSSAAEGDGQEGVFYTSRDRETGESLWMLA